MRLSERILTPAPATVPATTSTTVSRLMPESRRLEVKLRRTMEFSPISSKEPSSRAILSAEPEPAMMVSRG